MLISKKKKKIITVFVVDDVFFVRQSIYQTLGTRNPTRTLNLQFDFMGEAGLKTEFLDLLPKIKAMLYFLDVDLPDGEGWSLIDEIYAHNPHAKIVAMTDGLTIQTQNKRKDYEHRVLAILDKPFQPNMLNNVIDKLLEEEGLIKNSFVEENLTQKKQLNSRFMESSRLNEEFMRIETDEPIEVGERVKEDISHLENKIEEGETNQILLANSTELDESEITLTLEETSDDELFFELTTSETEEMTVNMIPNDLEQETETNNWFDFDEDESLDETEELSFFQQYLEKNIGEEGNSPISEIFLTMEDENQKKSEIKRQKEEFEKEEEEIVFLLEEEKEQKEDVRGESKIVYEKNVLSNRKSLVEDELIFNLEDEFSSMSNSQVSQPSKFEYFHSQNSYNETTNHNFDLKEDPVISPPRYGSQVTTPNSIHNRNYGYGTRKQ